METTSWTFWKFLQLNTIKIPIIQRDYAQGRKGKEELRKTFLNDLKTALVDNQQLKLDFVYGTRENDVLNPLDGQQRLTTLWLLHWYIAYCARALVPQTIQTLRKFTYETRQSSRIFCERLSSFSELPPAGIGVVQHIRNQTWFRHSWKNDPTIRAMLVTLGGVLQDGFDGIEGVFSCQDRDCIECHQCIFDEYWRQLSGSSCPIIFYHLDLYALHQTDDLYIKMNARGKPLTSFENFKADLTNYIEKRKNLDDWGCKEDRERLSNPSTGFAIKMDTEWMDIFWQKKSSDNVTDEIFYHFLNRFFFSELCLMKDADRYVVNAKNENENASYKFLNDSKQEEQNNISRNFYDLKVAYNGLSPYKFVGGIIPAKLFVKLAKVLENYHEVFFKSHEHFDSLENLLCPACEPDFHFIPHYVRKTNSKDEEKIIDNAGNDIRKTTVLTQPQRVLFLAVCKFLDELENDVPLEDCSNKLGICTRLRRWMRVVGNLVSVQDQSGRPQIRSFTSMRSAMQLVAGMNSQDVYGDLARVGEACIDTDERDSDESTLMAQYDEEIQKAKRILEGDGRYNGQVEEFKGKTWEEVIEKAEQSVFFKGAIRFLYKNETGNVDWTLFDIRYQNAKVYFDQNGVSGYYRQNSLMIRALLARIAMTDDLTDDFWFGNGSNFWRNQVLLNDEIQSIVAQLLQDRLTRESAMPDNNKVPDWIRDELLLCEAIEKDKIKDNYYGQWHIFTDWWRQGLSDKTLTRYSQRIKSNAIHPEEIIPLDNFRNALLAPMESDQKRGAKYFVGCNTDINFIYKGYRFRWYYDNGTSKIYVCMYNIQKDGVPKVYGLQDKFEVDENMAEKDFEHRLNGLIGRRTNEFGNM